MRKISNILFAVMILWGFAGFFGMDLLMLSANKLNTELPLSNPHDIVVDRLNNVYLGDGFFGVVQVYDKSGDYKDNWEVESFGGLFYIDLTENGNIAIYPVRGRNPITHRSYELIYDIKGNFLAENEIDHINPELEKNTKSCKDQNGSIYEIGGFIFPRIQKDGKTIIKQNLLLNSLTMPQSLLISLIGVILIIRINTKK